MADIDQWMQQNEGVWPQARRRRVAIGQNAQPPAIPLLAEEFKQASVGSDPTGERGSMYTMQQTEMHKLFTAFVDANMNVFVQKHKKTVQQFFEMCRKVRCPIGCGVGGSACRCFVVVIRGF